MRPLSFFDDEKEIWRNPVFPFPIIALRGTRPIPSKLWGIEISAAQSKSAFAFISRTF